METGDHSQPVTGQLEITGLPVGNRKLVLTFLWPAVGYLMLPHFQ